MREGLNPLTHYLHETRINKYYQKNLNGDCFTPIMSEAFFQFHPNFQHTPNTNAAIAFLDRDGVINEGYSTYVNHPDELVLLEGAADAISKLKQGGFLVCVVTNQSPLERNLWDHHVLASIHKQMFHELEKIESNAIVDLVLACPHKFSSSCICRKPESTLLRFGESILRNGTPNMSSNYGMTTLHSSFYKETNWFDDKPSPPHPNDAMIGDRRTDEGAGWGYGARTFRIRSNTSLLTLVPRILNRDDQGDDFHP